MRIQNTNICVYSHHLSVDISKTDTVEAITLHKYVIVILINLFMRRPRDIFIHRTLI